MQATQTEWSRLDRSDTVTLAELARCCAMSEAELGELVDYCALVPLATALPERAFSAEWVGPLRAAGKLRLEFDLDLFTVAIVLGNLNRIAALERQVRALQALLPARLREPA